MNILIDADGCPVVDLTLQIAKQFGVPVIILCDTAHQIEREGAQTLVFDKGADSVDFALVNRVKPGDIVVTQDYGLASMCLAKCARVLTRTVWNTPPTTWKLSCCGGMKTKSSSVPESTPRGVQSGRRSRMKHLSPH